MAEIVIYTCTEHQQHVMICSRKALKTNALRMSQDVLSCFLNKYSIDSANPDTYLRVQRYYFFLKYLSFAWCFF